MTKILLSLKGGFEEIMQIGKSRTPEDLWRLWEDQEWIFKRPQRLYSGRNSIPKFRGKLFEDRNLKRRKIGEIGSKEHHHAPRAHVMHVEHDKIFPCAQSIHMRLEHGSRCTLMRLEHCLCAPSIWNARGACIILCFLVGKARVFSPNPDRKSHYKYQPSSFRIYYSELWQFKRKALLELQRSFYLLLGFLGYVFIYSNLF